MITIAKPIKIIDFNKKKKELLKEKGNTPGTDNLNFIFNKKNVKWIVGMVILFLVVLFGVIFRAI
ncbi:MAG: hypothetical protein N4A40_05290 [Tissierellales bacterium]|nr:hypothetical protein [Tissierellales bacterium]